jgi:hypothetical protein
MAEVRPQKRYQDANTNILYTNDMAIRYSGHRACRRKAFLHLLHIDSSCMHLVVTSLLPCSCIPSYISKLVTLSELLAWERPLGWLPGKRSDPPTPTHSYTAIAAFTPSANIARAASTVQEGVEERSMHARCWGQAKWPMEAPCPVSRSSLLFHVPVLFSAAFQGSISL